MGTLRLIGACALVASAYMIVSKYKRFLNRRIEESDSFLGLIEYLKGEISCFLSPIGALMSDYRDEVLERVGFLGGISEGKDISTAYFACEGELSVGKEAKEILGRLFSDLGKRYKAETVLALSNAAASLSEYTNGLKNKAGEELKLCAALVFGGAMGLLLLLL